MDVIITTVLIATSLLVDREYRIFLVPMIAIASAILSIKKPVQSLGLIAASIGFPIYIRFMGRDVTTLTTLLIFELFIISLLRGMKIEKKLLIPCLMIMMIYAITTVSYSSQDLLLKSARMLFALTSGFLLLFVCQWILQKPNDHELIARILIFMVAFQALFSVFQVVSPEFASTISHVFSPRESVAGASVTGGVTRGRGAIGDYELLSEWIAAVFPLSMFFIYGGRKNGLLFVIVTIILMVGLISTVTRGAMLALIAATTLFLALVFLRGKVDPRILFLPIILMLGLGIVTLLFQDTLSQLVMRFNLIGINQISHMRTIDDYIALLNRRIWYQIPSNFEFNMFIGNGFFPFQRDSFSIHSLYLTIWYQSGILGVMGWFWILLVVMTKFFVSMNHLHRKVGSGPLLALIAGLIGMLLDEIKIEFLRQECTIQFFLLFVGLGISCYQTNVKKHSDAAFHRRLSIRPE